MYIHLIEKNLSRFDYLLLTMFHNHSLCDDCIEKRNVCKKNIHEVFDQTFVKIPIPDSCVDMPTLPIVIVDNMKNTCKL